MCCLRSAVSASLLAACVAAIASGVIGLAMMFSKLFNHVFSCELGVI
jgi:predicted regulator of Ras-like GTPase activity (Roadblock/LC7/MglB family)